MKLQLENGREKQGVQNGSFLDEFPINHNAVCIEPVARIRPYREEDQPAVRRICCDTGFLGEPVEAVFQDRELFSDLFTRPYLESEPEWALVAEVDSRVVGYLLGSVRKHFDLVLMRSGCQTACKMLLRCASGRYAQHRRSTQFVRWLLTAGFWEQPRHPANAAHLHFNIGKGFRGRGLCRHLWGVYEQQLRAAGVKQCYGSFFSLPGRRPEMIYARYGFTVFDRRRTSLFEPEISSPVEVVCVNKELNGG
ncbi:MAG: hypothetical protein C5B50_16315 [Verrucomicrobia bacterium]|nr:MAG: hypothetical protein C5B50_16315 [Verrucomicrobiota bacterium]